VRQDLARDVDAGVVHARKLAQRVDDGRADARDLALRRIAELDVEGDVAAVDLDVLDCLGGDEIFMGVGIDDSGQGGLDVIYSDAQWVLRM
jgi:hypothetical protein